MLAVRSQAILLTCRKKESKPQPGRRLMTPNFVFVLQELQAELAHLNVPAPSMSTSSLDPLEVGTEVLQNQTRYLNLYMSHT